MSLKKLGSFTIKEFTPGDPSWTNPNLFVGEIVNVYYELDFFYNDYPLHVETFDQLVLGSDLCIDEIKFKEEKEFFEIYNKTIKESTIIGIIE